MKDHRESQLMDAKSRAACLRLAADGQRAFVVVVLSGKVAPRLGLKLDVLRPI